MTVIAIPFARVQSLYRQRNPMGHWFDPATMGFFGTVLPDTAYQNIENNDIYFYSRETNPSRETRYSVRVLTVAGDIKTVGKFHSIDSEGDALMATIAAGGGA